MNAEEAKARVAAQDVKLHGLDAEIVKLASTHAKPVLIAMLHALVKMVCAALRGTPQDQALHGRVAHTAREGDDMITKVQDRTSSPAAPARQSRSTKLPSADAKSPTYEVT